MSPRQPNLFDVFQQLGELKATVENIVARQSEEIQKSAVHRERMYEKIEIVEGTLKENTNKIAEMTPVFERAEAAEHARKVYKWQARAALVALGGTLTAIANYFLKHLG